MLAGTLTNQASEKRYSSIIIWCKDVVQRVWNPGGERATGGGGALQRIEGKTLYRSTSQGRLLIYCWLLGSRGSSILMPSIMLMGPSGNPLHCRCPPPSTSTAFSIARTALLTPHADTKASCQDQVHLMWPLVITFTSLDFQWRPETVGPRTASSRTDYRVKRGFICGCKPIQHLDYSHNLYKWMSLTATGKKLFSY